MKVKASLKSYRNRDKNCKVVKRDGKIYVINKVKPRCKARQGS
ncbi:50S ribosomal protein L36 [Wolbachia endosymbiont of Armadillidium vulgare str. wVulC]|nr:MULTISPECIES: type B 50S ribosomal protein L36 [unclassified Wolbachia]KLT22802.1 50S ribosomal protein L36 [Wolbachia endosymbiont of Armadillidium vulgare str. wVulC]RDD35448.1 50S ribosomal protein L36 [Wolbachia endosymbiont of Cylisticus convexus]